MIEVRELIRRIGAANLGWGAPRIHGESGKLGIKASETYGGQVRVGAWPPAGTLRVVSARNIAVSKPPPKIRAPY